MTKFLLALGICRLPGPLKGRLWIEIWWASPNGPSASSEAT